DDWGNHGFGHLSYDDWLANGTDVWVARLAVPVELAASGAAVGTTVRSTGARVKAILDLRPPIVSLGNDGDFPSGGAYGTDKPRLAKMIKQDIPDAMKKWKKKRVLLYAHGGLVDEASAVQKVANYRGPLLDNEVYPVSFIWKTDYLSTLTFIIQDAF